MLVCEVAASGLYSWLYRDIGLLEWGTAIAFQHRGTQCLLMAIGFMLSAINNWQRYGRVRAPVANFGRIASGQSGSPRTD